MSQLHATVSRYRLRPEEVERCLDVGARTQRVHARHVPMTSLHLSAEDREVWPERNTFPEEETDGRGIELANADPQHSGVWRELETALAGAAVGAASFEEVLSVT